MGPKTVTIIIDNMVGGHLEVGGIDGVMVHSH